MTKDSDRHTQGNSRSHHGVHTHTHSHLTADISVPKLRHHKRRRKIMISGLVVVEVVVSRDFIYFIVFFFSYITLVMPSKLPLKFSLAARKREQRKTCFLSCIILLAVLGAIQVNNFDGPILGQMLGNSIQYKAIDEQQQAFFGTFESDVQNWMLQAPELQEQIAKKQFRSIVQIEKIPKREMSFSRFFREYSNKSMPVVVSGVRFSSRMNLTRETLREHCSYSRVRPLVPTKQNGTKWADLEPLSAMTVSSFLDILENNITIPSPYMHDWSIPKNCRELLNYYEVPKYVAQDYLKSIEIDTTGAEWISGKSRPFAESWPSLFVGEAATGSGLHIDNSDTHFVMHMLEGTKRFRLVRPLDRLVVYENRQKGTMKGNLFSPDFNKFPLMSLATVYEVDLKAGDFLFVPGGSSHQVVNLSPIIGISTNYVDDSNAQRVATLMRASGNAKFSNSLTDNIKELKTITSMSVSDTPWENLNIGYNSKPLPKPTARRKHSKK